MNYLNFDVIYEISRYNDHIMCALYPNIQLTPRLSALKYCIENDNTECFREMFSKCDLSVVDIENLYKKSFTKSRIEIVKIIIPHLNINQPHLQHMLFTPIYDKCTELAILLIESGVDPSIDDNYAVVLSVKTKNYELLKYLLTLWEVDPFYNDAEAFWWAMWNKEQVSANMLWNHHRCMVPISTSDFHEILSI